MATGRLFSNRFNFIFLIVGFTLGFTLSLLFIANENYAVEDHKSLQHSIHLVSGNTTVAPKNTTTNTTMQTITLSPAQKLEKEVRILCWVLTCPKNHKRKAIHVKRTWGKRCNKLIFISTKYDKELDTVVVPVNESYNKLWAKTKAAFRYIYANHLNDYDWFLKADDDTYVVVENLRYMLYTYSPEMPVYFGCRFKVFVRQGYMSGGAGYVLSREAVRRFVEKSLPHPKRCHAGEGGAEDLEMGRCLQNAKVLPGDSRDVNGEWRFFPGSPSYSVPNSLHTMGWLKSYAFYEFKKGNNCCSPHTITFHYVSPHDMYSLDFLVYKLRPYGIPYEEDPLPPVVEGRGYVPMEWDENSTTTTESVKTMKKVTRINQTTMKDIKRNTKEKKRKKGTKLMNTGTKTISTESDKISTGSKKISTGSKKISTGSEKISTGSNKISTESQKISIGRKKLSTGSKKLSTGRKKISTGSEKISTGSNKISTESQKISIGSKKISTRSKKMNTGAKKINKRSLRTAKGTKKTREGSQSNTKKSKRTKKTNKNQTTSKYTRIQKTPSGTSRTSKGIRKTSKGTKKSSNHTKKVIKAAKIRKVLETWSAKTTGDLSKMSQGV